MLRRTNVSLIVPLPLYKVAIVLIRQFSRPVVVQALNVANEYPQLRKCLIYVGWHHYRISCQLHRVIWGAEHQEQQQQQQQTTDAQKQEGTPTKNPDEKSAVGESKGTEKIAIEATPVATANAEIAQKIKDEIVANATPLNANVGIAAIGGVHKKVEVISTSPRTIKILPGIRSTAGFNPLKSVRNIFVAPARPSDEELLKKGMQLCVETAMFLCVCLVILYEMRVSSADLRAKRILMEERFLRLESHIVHFPGCGCPVGTLDGEPPADEHLETGLEKLIPDRQKIRREWTQHHGGTPAVAAAGPVSSTGTKSNNEGVAKNNNSVDGKSIVESSTASSATTNISQKQQTGNSTSNTTSPASSITKDTAISGTNTNNNISNTSTPLAIQSQQPQQQHHHQRRVTGQLARLPTGISDLVSIWCSLPMDVQIVVVAVFAAPYFFMAAIMLRLFTLVHRVQRQS